MKKLVLLIVLAGVARCPAGGGRQGRRRLGEAGPGHHDHPRRLGHCARLGQDRCRRGVRRDVRAGRGRLQPRRDELPELDGPPGGGRGRSGDLPRPADEAVHRPGRHEGAVPEEPRVAEEADERVRRRPELLPLQASRREAARDHAFRAVDGADLQRGEHRRRHREGEPEPARGVLRQDAAEDARRTRPPRRNWTASSSRPDRTAPRSRRPTPRRTTRCC